MCSLHVRLGSLGEQASKQLRYIERQLHQSQLHRKRIRIVCWSRPPHSRRPMDSSERGSRDAAVCLWDHPYQVLCNISTSRRQQPRRLCVVSKREGRIHRVAAGERCPGPPPHTTSHHIPRPTCLPCRWTPSGMATNRNRDRDDDDDGGNNRRVRPKLAVRHVQGWSPNTSTPQRPLFHNLCKALDRAEPQCQCQQQTHGSTKISIHSFPATPAKQKTSLLSRRSRRSKSSHHSLPSSSDP